MLTLAGRTHHITLALEQAGHRPPVVVAEDFDTALEPPSRRAEATQPRPETPASFLYTSGTTGRPKGCILSHGYEVATGAWYAALPGIAGLRRGQDRIYNPLTLYHANSGVISLFGTILSGNCQIQPDRFHPLRWWREIAETRAGRALSRHHRPTVAEPASGRTQAEPLPPLRHRCRDRAATSSSVRGALGFR